MCRNLLLYTASLFPVLASAAVYNATPSTYVSMAGQLQAGDTLNLAAGMYGTLNINGRNGNPSAWITITGPASGPPAILTGKSCCNTVEITNSSYVALRNVTVDSKGLPGIFGVSCAGASNVSHHILLEGNTFIGQHGSQQTVAISTKATTWGWVVRKNTITGAGTGIYFGNSNGAAPFVAGLIEHNLIRNTIGYNMQIKHQLPRPVIVGMPAGPSVTVIRHNVFIKDDQPSPDGDRPNLLLGGFPDSGDGSSDMYEVYGNFFYYNPREALFQAEGRLSIHDNVFVGGGYAAAVFRATYLALKVAHVYNNTVYSTSQGLQFGSAASASHAVTGNLVFAAAPISGALTNSSNNLTDTLANASAYVVSPSFALSAMDFYPLPGKVRGPALDLAPFAADPAHAVDFNGVSKMPSPIFRGAYAGEGVNRGWRLSASIKPPSTPPAAALAALVCAPASLTAGQSASCTASLAAAVESGSTVSLAATGPLTAPGSVTIAAGALSASFTASAGSVTASQDATLTAAINGGSKSAVFTIAPPTPVLPVLQSMACAPNPVTSGSPSNCTITLSAAPASSAAISIGLGSSAVTAPPTVWTSAGASTTSFAVTTGDVATTQIITITAALNSSSVNTGLSVQPSTPRPAFLFRGLPTEVTALTDGAAVVPASVPAAMSGKLTVRGAGSAAFLPFLDGAGIVFGKGGQQNRDTAFVQFPGEPLRNVFGAGRGDVTFYLQSSYSFSQRLLLPQANYRCIFDVYDATRELFYFCSYASANRLVFTYRAGGPSSFSYFVPAGQEETVFGRNVVAKFRIAWDGATATLYLNDKVVKGPFTNMPLQPSWTAASLFTVGATAGGYYPADDGIAGFEVR